MISVFARLGGIYTKSADVGADLVGKVEAAFRKTTPQPGCDCRQRWNNVGLCRDGGNLFETYAITAIGAMLLVNVLPGQQYVIYR